MSETPIDQPSLAPRVKRLPPSKVDQLRGLKESRAQIEVLKAKWPSIFNDPKNVRPLAGSVLHQVATALGWSNGYTRGVFKVWKGRNAYCRAVLCYSVRMNLDGSPSDETVNDRDRELAKGQLAKNAVRNAAKRDRELAEANGKKAQDEDERTQLWRESAKGVPHTPPLSDAAVSRESFYDAQG
jgi:sRNA-binding protein